jgi:hypothetical protein
MSLEMIATYWKEIMQVGNKIQHFLLVFDHEAGRLTDIQKFGSRSEDAVAAYSAKERELRDRPFMEIESPFPNTSRGSTVSP